MEVSREALADPNALIAQLITVGKRAAQWAQDLMFDLESIELVRNGLKFRGTFFNLPPYISLFSEVRFLPEHLSLLAL
jgi:adenylosuccinate lyase